MKGKFPVGVAGSGSMGTGIAQVAALAGHPVVVMDTNPHALEHARSRLQTDFGKLVDKGKLTGPVSGQFLESISYSGDVSGFRDCGLVIEAIVEDLSVKKQLFANMEAIVSASCVLATNTSSLPVVAVASGCRNRSRVIGIHFFNPAQVMPLVEIIPAFTTSDQVANDMKILIAEWGKTTVMAKDTPGFIVNRIARPYYGEAIKMLEEGIADVSTIDWAMKRFGGFRMGPFELMDFIGNDVNYKVTETVWEQFFYDPRYRPSLTQKRLYEAGLFGRKSGRGYYDYGTGSVNPVAAEDEPKGSYIFNRILSMLINEAADALYMRIATRDDIDTAMTNGVNYPKGLLRWADEVGVREVLRTLVTLHDDYLDDRYRPSLLLKKMAAEGRTFY
jgi:3-hydroxybutyryl-CoA dehydrogenase